MAAMSLSGDKMLAWDRRTADGWKALVARDGAVLDVPCDVYGMSDLRGLLRHIVAVQLRYAQRLAALEESPYEAIGLDAEAIFAKHDEAHAMLSRLVADAAYDWSASQEFLTISWGMVTSHRTTMFTHAVMHGVRHWAQAAMLARQAGFKPDWSMDYLAMDAVKIEG